jgi:hypothetical protein
VKHPDIRDLGNLLEQLRERHTLVYYFVAAFTALGIFGLLCIVGAIR